MMGAMKKPEQQSFVYFAAIRAVLHTQWVTYAGRVLLLNQVIDNTAAAKPTKRI